MLTGIEIFEILNRNRNFFGKIDRNRDFQNFETKSKFSRNCWPKSRFSKFWTEIEIFWKMLSEIKIVQILNRNRFFFRKYWPKSRFSKFWTQIEIFFGNVDRNLDFRNFEIFHILNEMEIFSNMFIENLIFEILKRNRFFFENVDRYFEPKMFFFSKRFTGIEFSKFWTEIDFFRKCWPKPKFPNLQPKSNFFVNVDRNRDFRNFEPKSEIFRKCWRKWRFSKFWTEFFFSKM